MHIIIYHSGHKSYLKSHKYMSIMLYIYPHIRLSHPRNIAQEQPETTEDVDFGASWLPRASQNLGCLGCDVVEIPGSNRNTLWLCQRSY